MENISRENYEDRYKKNIPKDVYQRILDIHDSNKALSEIISKKYFFAEVKKTRRGSMVTTPALSKQYRDHERFSRTIIKLEALKGALKDKIFYLYYFFSVFFVLMMVLRNEHSSLYSMELVYLACACVLLFTSLVMFQVGKIRAIQLSLQKNNYHIKNIELFYYRYKGFPKIR